MRRLFLFLVFMGGLMASYVTSHRGRSRDAFGRICSLVSNHFYLNTPAVQSWIARCDQSARALPRFISTDQLLARAQDLMDELRVSHFNVYAPAEDEKLWTGRAVHTGIRARFVEAHLIVYEVLAGSAAAAADVRPGDEILTIPGIDEVSPAGASFRAGEYKLTRAGRTFGVRLNPGPVQVSGAPSVRAVDERVSVLTIPSFRAEYFAPAAWSRITRQLAGRAGVIVDVRENSGGNFAAMLRALSFFSCGERTIGRLVQERSPVERTARLIDVTDDEVQIEQLEHVKYLDLTTPAGYGCYRGPVITLVTSRTASVAEIFADAMSTRPGSRVWGWPTAGDVVLAVWYDLPSLGPGFSTSIPRAQYVNASGRALEGAGVRPARELFHDLETSRRGIDGWISAATRSLR